MNWRTEAACAGMDGEIFFPLPLDTATREAAQAACADCTVSEACLADARERGDQHGIRGGVDLALARMMRPHRKLETAEVTG